MVAYQKRWSVCVLLFMAVMVGCGVAFCFDGRKQDKNATDKIPAYMQSFRAAKAGPVTTVITVNGTISMEDKVILIRPNIPGSRNFPVRLDLKTGEMEWFNLYTQQWVPVEKGSQDYMLRLQGMVDIITGALTNDQDLTKTERAFLINVRAHLNKFK